MATGDDTTGLWNGAPPPRENWSRLRLPVAWKPRWLREWGAMPYVVACLQAVIATRAA